MDCAHCNATVLLNPKRTRPRGWCRKCSAYVCDNAVCSTTCTPIGRLIDIAVRHPDAPALLRGPNGELLISDSLLEEGRVF